MTIYFQWIYLSKTHLFYTYCVQSTIHCRGLWNCPRHSIYNLWFFSSHTRVPSLSGSSQNELLTDRWLFWKGILSVLVGDWNKLNRERGKASPRMCYWAGPCYGSLSSIPLGPLRGAMWNISHNCLPCMQLVVIAAARVKRRWEDGRQDTKGAWNKCILQIYLVWR